MTLNVYTIFDKVDGSASQLVLGRSDARIARDFVRMVRAREKDIANNGGSVPSLNDFEIRHIGTFDDERCVLMPTEPVVVPFSLAES